MVLAQPAITAPMLPTPLAFDELGSSLFDVTFVVVDLETTGGSPAACAITEVGAVKYRGGECLATFQSLVNPGVPIPPFITVLTGITDTMLLPAPRIREVLPVLLEFIGGAVLVGHNLRFDTSFLDAALVRHGYAPLANRRVDTLGLARRLLRDDVVNHKLGTLANHFGTATEPSHRALDDAAATAEVLHGLIEGASGFAVFGLDDLLTLPKVRDHPSSTKLGLTAPLPRTAGVYWFRDRNGRVLHVGRADNLRARVRSYFGGKHGGAALQLLRELTTVEHVECASELEASVRELRLIRLHQPRYNPGPSGRAYVKVTLGERFPRIAVVRSRPSAGSVFLGPLPSTVWAQRVKEAIEAALPLRRCTNRIRATEPACCPCGGSVDVATYALVVERAIGAFADDATPLIDALTARLDALATVGRYEEAARTRDRLRALVAALDRQARLDSLRRAGRLRIEAFGTTIDIDGGRLLLDDNDNDSDNDEKDNSVDADAEEVLLVGRWLDRAQHLGQRVGSRGRMRVR
ncbi:MAG: DEDD exonuclease domain-containing protein [Acidimicrobiia bacterium]